MISTGVFQVLTLVVIVILSIRADCNNPPVIANSKHNITTRFPPYPEGTVVRFDCNIGYNPTGTSRFYTCNGTEWIGGPFQCETIYCSRIERPENGQIINQPTNEVGTVIKFACNEGYDMSSSDSMLCRADGNWSPASPPTCTAKDCGEFGTIQYASVFQDNSNVEGNNFGSVVEVTCLDGRVLNGPPRVECKANGQWGERPTCELLQCPPYPNANTSCVYKSTLQGDFYYIMCKKDMSTKTGPEIVQCINGEWDSLEMACYCDCKIPDFNTSLFILSNLNSYGNLAHNMKLLWTCVNGSSVSPLSYMYSVICTDGELRVMKNKEEILSTSEATMYDVYQKTMSEVCILPTTTTTTTVSTTTTTITTTITTTTMTSSSVTKEAFEEHLSNRSTPTEAEFVTTTTAVKLTSAASTHIIDVQTYAVVFFALIL